MGATPPTVERTPPGETLAIDPYSTMPSSALATAWATLPGTGSRVMSILTLGVPVSTVRVSNGAEANRAVCPGSPR